MKKIALCVLVGLATLGSAFANPIKGLVDVATGKEVPDADLRYMKIGVTNSSAVFSNLYVLASATGNYDVVNWFSMTNYIGTGALTNETLAVVTARGSNTSHNIFVRDMTVSGTVYCIDEAIVFRDATALNENIGMEIDIHPVNSQTASVWVGYGALAGASGRYNTGLGYKAGGSHTGSYNTAVGLCSLYMGYNGEKNTALGYYSGARSAGVSNVFMGYYAGYYASKTAVTNAIAIGAGVVPKGNNTAVWGRSDQTNYFDGMIIASNDVLPFASNTIDIGSQTMPFRSVNASNFNLVGSSISFNGVPYLLSSNGTLICTVPFYTVSGVTNGFDYVLVNDLIGNTLSVSNGAFTELTVSTAASSGIQAVNWETMTNYVGSHSSSLPSNLVFSISNNYYAVGTTQQMDRLVVSNLQVVAGGTVDFFGNIFTNAITNQVLYADGSQAWTGNQNAGGFGITNIGFLVPSGSNTVDLGSAALPFRDLYLGSNSIYMAGTKMFSTSNNQLVVGLPMASASGGTYLIPSYAEGWTTNGTLTLTNQATYYAWATWTPGEYSSDIGWTNNGVYIKEASAAGLYQITGNLSVSQNQNTEPLEAEVYYGPVGSPTNHHEKLSGHAYMAVSGQIYSIPVGGFLRLNVGEYCELRFANATGAGRVVSAVGGVINFRMLKIAN